MDTPFIIMTGLLILVTLLLEHSMGRKVGTLTMFAPNSRGIADIYSLSHIMHGFVFYWAFVYMLGLAIPLAVFASILCECIWEVWENSPYIINRYRKTVAANYEGDTLINSFSDICCMSAGLAAAYFVTAPTMIATTMGFELFALWKTRDNLCLNIIMLIYPFEKIKQWQGNDHER